MTLAGSAYVERLDVEYREGFSALPERTFDPHDVKASVEVIRAAGAARRAGMAPVTLPDGLVTEDVMAPGASGDPDVRVRLYRPAAMQSPAPTLYYVHGGGMIGGDIETTEANCATIADRFGALVASVDYRLAPEHPYPAPLEDCYAGLRWVWEQAGELGVDRERLGIGGGSAGGGLAAGLALLTRDRGEVHLCYQHLVYPMIDDRNVTASSHAVTDPRIWNRDSNHVGWNAYLAGNAGGDDVPYTAAPARASVDELQGLPPAYICVGTMDLFMDEDVAYAQALRSAGVPVELHVYPGAFHGSQNSIPGAALSRRWRADELSAIGRALRAE